MQETLIESFRLSPQQRHLCAIQWEKEPLSFHIYYAVQLEGSLDVARLRSALERLVERHEILRTSFPCLPGFRLPVQVINTEMPLPFVVCDLRSEAPHEQEKALRQLQEEGAKRSFTLQDGPLWQVTLVLCAAERHVLLWSLSALCADTKTAQLLLHELSQLYYAEGRGSVEGSAEPLQYADLAEWQYELLEAAETEQGREYWHAFESALLKEVVLPYELSTDRMRPFTSCSVSSDVSPVDYTQLQVQAQKLKVTPATVLLTCWGIVLSRLSGQNSLPISCAYNGRTHAELSGAVGLLAKFLPLPYQFLEEATLSEVVHQVETTLHEADRWQIYFDWPLFEAFKGQEQEPFPAFGFTYETLPPAWQTGALRWTVAEQGGVLERFNVHLSCLETAAGMQITLHYDAEKFALEDMQRLLTQWQTVFQQVLISSDWSVGFLQLLTYEEQQHMLLDWNATRAEYPQETCLHQLFEMQVERTPDSIAVVSTDEQISYLELDRRANQIAHYLQRRGVGPEVRVGICLERSTYLLMGLLGILKANGAYVPCDPTHPQERLAFMLQDANISLLLTQEQLRELLLPITESEIVCLDAVDEVFADDLPARLESKGSAEQLAYVLYTSGSTGQPKGVMVPHCGLVNYLYWAVQTYAPSDRSGTYGAPLHSPIGFDLTVTSLFVPLLSGQSILILPDDEGITALGSALGRKNQFTLTKVTPAHLGALSQFDAAEQLTGGTQVLVIGGEALWSESLALWRQYAPQTRLINEYGPTETVVGCCVYEVSAETASSGVVPIGRPIANLQMYVLNTYLQPVPIGVPAELYVGGAGVTRGYLNSPAQTAERFIPHPFSSEPGARLYRTGDIAEFRPNGDLEYVGRADQQVKIHGYRIEPGEIEMHLRQHPGVQECVVLAREDMPGKKRLVAYVVLRQRQTFRNSNIRVYLQEHLPSYMIPAVFVPLIALPLTPNGKIDRRKLLSLDDMRIEQAEDFVAPRTHVEATLATIWSQVLHVEHIGIHDNFFALGGDSILSIQIVTRAKQAGLHMTPRHLFQHQSIAQLSGVVTSSVSVPAEQALVTGPVPLTPIQHWFFERHLPEPHHFNQAIVLQTYHSLRPAWIEEVLMHLVLHHDALRLRFVPHADGWQQTIAGVPSHPFCLCVDLSALLPDRQQVAQALLAEEAQARLDLTAGILLRALFFVHGGATADHLLLIIHHMAVDGVSWRILIEDLESLCRQVSQGEALHLAAKTMSWQHWAQRLQDYAQSEALLATRSYWLAPSRQHIVPLPVDMHSSEKRLAGSEVLHVALDGQQTQSLLHEVSSAYHTQINDLLLTALAQAFATWTGQHRLLIDLEGHGREEVMGEEDLSRTVGWFTTLFPVLLDIEQASGLREALKAIKEQVRQVPEKGLSYGVLRYLSRDEQVVEQGAHLPQAEVLFNYLGQFDVSADEHSLFGLARVSAGSTHSMSEPQSHLLEINGRIVEGQLSFSWRYNRRIHQRETIQKLAQSFIEHLEKLIAHCQGLETSEYTPSDFPLAMLEQSQLDVLIQRIHQAGGLDQQIEDIYPLSSMQAGLLFHSLYAPDAGVYSLQFGWTIQGALNREAWEWAWQQVIKRHSILRTCFVWQGLTEPLQVVYKHSEIPCEVYDWRSLSEQEQRQRLDILLQEKELKSFDLGTAPLLRLVLVRLGDQTHYFHLSLHHLIIDGWSQSLLLREVQECYQAACQGKSSGLLPARSYRDYIAWMRRQDTQRAEQFWRSYLNGFTTPNLLPGYEGVSSPTGPQTAIRQLECSAELTTSLRERARQLQITLNTLFQGAWALLLSHYSGEKDVLFGATTTGRPSELTGVEAMVGVFINTLPVRVRVIADTLLSDWLRQLQEEQVEARQYEYASLAQIQTWSGGQPGQSLFESLMIFQNYPVAASMLEQSSEVVIRRASTREQTHYPLLVKIVPTDTALVLLLQYDEARFEAAMMVRMLQQLQVFLQAIVNQPEQKLGTLSLLSEEERYQLLIAWNATEVAASEHACIHQLFEQQVERTPEAVALVFEEQVLTYGELNRRANQLAHFLKTLGVGPEKLVGICIERSSEMVIGLLAVLKAGGAYVPLDPQYPRERLTFIMADSELVLILTYHLPEVLRSGTQGIPALDLSKEWQVIATQCAEKPYENGSSQNLAYVISTSGSSGRPKGTMVQHRNVTNFFTAMDAYFGEQEPGIWLAVTSISFDISVLELLWTLTQGFQVVVRASEEQVSSGQKRPYEALPAQIQRLGVTHLQCTPSQAKLFFAEPEMLSALRSLQMLLLGGEALPLALLKSLGEAVGGEIHNMYGPTETSIWSLTQRMQKNARRVVIGRPIANTQVYIVDVHGRCVPIGGVGELIIGGKGVVRGYLNRPDVTAEKFLPDPWTGEVGARCYRTGDLARYRSDGSIEYLGRMDQQVKLRGYRIELGEIEAVLRELEGVNDAVVQVQEGADGQQWLVAYVVGSEEVRGGELRSVLQEKLPVYMVPGRFVRLEVLPLTPNGKVDRKALPVLSQGEGEENEASQSPMTPMEELVQGLWRTVLGRAQVGMHENFFALGGHSLLATQLIGRTRKMLGIEIPLRVVFEEPTVAEFARQIEQTLRQNEKVQIPALVAMERPEVLPLSFAQHRLWFLARLEPESTAYLIPMVLRVGGELDARALEQSWQELVRRHESLRTTFEERTGQPVQVIQPVADFPLPVIDLCGLHAEQRRAEARNLATQEARRPCDLARGPLLRTTLLRVERDDHVLLLTLHHIITDGWSMGVLVRELTTLYRSFVAGKPSPLPSLPIQYVDYALWQRHWLQGEVLETQLAYWKKQLAGITPLQLPLDRPRLSRGSHRGAAYSFPIARDLAEALMQLSSQEQVTLFMLLLAAFMTLLHHVSEQDDIVVGTDVANRHHVEVEGVIGFLVNQLVLRVSIAKNPTFRELLQQVRTMALEAYAHQDLPFEKLVDELRLMRQRQPSSLFHVKFLLDRMGSQAPKTHDELLVPAVTVSQEKLSAAVSRGEDLLLRFSEGPQGLFGTFTYNTEVLDAVTITSIAQRFVTLIGRIAANPDSRLDMLNILTEKEKEKETMEKQKKINDAFQQFRLVQPKPVRVNPEALIHTSHLSMENRLPLVISPQKGILNLVEWATSQQPFLEANLLKHGALLFRGFDVSSPVDFEQFALTLCSDLFEENGEHVAAGIGTGALYTPVFYAPEKKLLWHTENSFNATWPQKIFFYCAQPAARGGETPIADNRSVFERIDPSIRESFQRKGIMYIRTYGEGLGLPWQKVFRTEKKEEVERYCQKEGIDFAWKDQQLKTRLVRPAVLKHPQTGEWLWWNQATHWHPACLEDEVRASLQALFSEEDLPRNCFYGDGSPIEDEVMDAICQAYQDAEVSFPWRQGDILLLDNMLVAHARNPYEGPRKIYVSMGNMVTLKDLSEAR